MFKTLEECKKNLKSEGNGMIYTYQNESGFYWTNFQIKNKTEISCHIVINIGK